MEDFLTMASEQQMHARQQRDINLQVESPEGHRCVTTCKRMKSDFHAMHRSQRMKSIMQKCNAAAALVAPEQHHKMGEIERQLRRGHEAAGANLSENNLPAKHRCCAAKAAIRAGDYLGTRAKPRNVTTEIHAETDGRRNKAKQNAHGHETGDALWRRVLCKTVQTQQGRAQSTGTRKMLWAL